MTPISPLPALIASSPLTTIADVIALMQRIDAVLPNEDGLKWFNFLYWKVTEAVQNQPPAGGWHDAAWLLRLDVVFASLYFQAIADWYENPTHVARAWTPLLQSRGRQDIMRVQFALAGMNAHINHDLPIAVVQTCREQHITPTPDTPQHQDYERVNDILAVEEELIKQYLATGIVGLIAQDLGKLGDVLAMWSVRTARDTAWNNAEILWGLNSIPYLRDVFLLNLDRFVGFSSRGLLAVMK